MDAKHKINCKHLINNKEKRNSKTLGIHDRIEQAPHVANCALGVGETHPQNNDILHKTTFSKRKAETQPNEALFRKQDK